MDRPFYFQLPAISAKKRRRATTLFGNLLGGAQAFVNFTGFVIAHAINDGFLNVGAGHFHEVALFVLFLDHRTKMFCGVYG
jgi:hypothetical protein